MTVVAIRSLMTDKSFESSYWFPRTLIIKNLFKEIAQKTAPIKAKIVRVKRLAPLFQSILFLVNFVLLLLRRGLLTSCEAML